MKDIKPPVKQEKEKEKEKEMKETSENKNIKSEKAFEIFKSLLTNSSIISTVGDIYTIKNREVELTQRTIHLIKSSVLVAEEFYKIINPVTVSKEEEK
jgi:hypothetical protein